MKLIIFSFKSYMVKKLTSLTSDKHEFTQVIQTCRNRRAARKPKILKEIFKGYLYENTVLIDNCWISFYFLMIYEVGMKLLSGRNRANTAREYTSMSFSDLCQGSIIKNAVCTTETHKAISVQKGFYYLFIKHIML